MVERNHVVIVFGGIKALKPSIRKIFLLALTVLEKGFEICYAAFQCIVVFLESLEDGFVTVLADGHWVFAPGTLVMVQE